MSHWQEYYEITRERPPDPTLEFACARVDAALPKAAIDCGCGAGRGIDFMLGQGFSVHAFDLEADGIRVCRDRFAGDDRVTLAQAGFDTYDYPQASLVVAINSLFFCKADEFRSGWKKIVECLAPGGVFFGSFIGPHDSWADPDYVFDEAPDLEILVHSEEEIDSFFQGFDILERDVKDYDGETARGTLKHWHLISVVARKRASERPGTT